MLIGCKPRDPGVHPTWGMGALGVLVVPWKPYRGQVGAMYLGGCPCGGSTGVTPSRWGSGTWGLSQFGAHGLGTYLFLVGRGISSTVIIVYTKF